MRRALLSLLLAGCAGSSGSGSPPLAVPFATYGLEPLLCASTGAAPAYPSVDRKAALFAFDELTAHTLQVAMGEAVETLSDADCTLAVTRSVAQNSGNAFALRQDRRHVFTPDGCALTVVFAGQRYEVSRATTTLFTDRASQDVELAFDVVTRDVTHLVLQTRPELAAAWQAYGCSSADFLTQSLEIK